MLLLRNRKVYNHVHSSSPLIPVMIKVNPVHALTAYSFKTQFSTFHHLRLRIPSGLLTLGRFN